MKKYLLLAGIVLSTPVLAEEIVLSGNSWINTCSTPTSGGYYSGAATAVDIGFHDDTLPWGTRVFLRYGFERYQSGELVATWDLPWNDSGEMELEASAPYTWSGKLTQQMHARSSSFRYHGMNFAVRVVYPNGEERFVKGGDSTFGYMRATFPRAFCGSEDQSPIYLSVENVENW